MIHPKLIGQSDFLSLEFRILIERAHLLAYSIVPPVDELRVQEGDRSIAKDTFMYEHTLIPSGESPVVNPYKSPSYLIPSGTAHCYSKELLLSVKCETPPWVETTGDCVCNLARESWGDYLISIDR